MIALLSFYRDPNIGLYGKATDKFLLLGLPIEERLVKEVLGVKSLRISVAGTEFVGLFIALNSNGVILPRVTMQAEVKKFKELGLNTLILTSNYTAVGNLVAVNDKGAVISKLFSRRERGKIEDTLAVETVFGDIAGMPIVGSCCFATNKGCLLHRDAKEDEVELVESVLRVRVSKATLNFGSPFVSSGIIANRRGALIGDRSTGPEISRVMEGLKV